jgi:hypothetical protein
VFPLIVQLAIVGEALSEQLTPPPSMAKFSRIAQFVIVGEALPQ